MASILPFDELNSFTIKLRERFPDGKLRTTQDEKVPAEEEDDIIDEMLDLFLLAYATGNTVTSENLSFDWTPTLSDVTEVVNKEVAGKTWKERVEEYFSKGSAEGGTPQTGALGQTGSAGGVTPSTGTKSETNRPSGSAGTVDDIIRIAETETHRIANEAALSTAKRAGATRKTWITMMDEKVRDSHQYLEMMSVGIDEDFYTYDGDHAPAPGLFFLPENNVNCRCELVFS